MHWTRIWTLLGVILGVIALFMKGATSAGEELLAALSEGGQFPDGISTIWGGLDTWVQYVVVVAIVAVVVLALMPPIKLVERAAAALTTTVIGAALLVYGIIKFVEAGNDASDLEGAFALAAEAGAIPEAFTVTVGSGFYVLMAGTAMVAIGGLVMMLIKDTADETAAA